MLSKIVMGAGGTGGGPIAFVAASSAIITLPNTVTINYPAGIKTGDLVVVVVANDSSSSITGWNAPSEGGWTIFGSTSGGGTQYASMFKFYNPSMGSSVTIVGNGADGTVRGGGAMTVYRNVTTFYPSGPDYVGGTGPNYPFGSGFTYSTPTFIFCICVNDDDIPTSVTQSGFTVNFSGFLGSAASNGCGFGITSNAAFTGGPPPDIFMNGVSGEPATTQWVALV